VVKFENLNAFEILSYGVIGLGFLLAVLAYFLLNREQKLDNVRDSMLKAINRFMVFSFSLCTIGIMSEMLKAYVPNNLQTHSTMIQPVNLASFSNIDLRHASQLLGEVYSARVSSWLNERHSELGKIATRITKEKNTSSYHNVLQQASPFVYKYSGGIYILDKKGTVIVQDKTHIPNMKNIIGYDASHRDYFIKTKKNLENTVSNIFSSANRSRDIIVFAVPLITLDGSFSGILNAVVTVDKQNSPFTPMANAALNEMCLLNHPTKNLNLALFDSENNILGQSGKNNKASFLEVNNFLNYTLKDKKGSEKSGFGSIINIPNSPYFVFSFWR